jgi:hypothetical protein
MREYYDLESQTEMRWGYRRVAVLSISVDADGFLSLHGGGFVGGAGGFIAPGAKLHKGDRLGIEA